MSTQFPPGYLEAYNGHKLVATCISCMVLIIFFVAARFTSRAIHQTPKGWDDYLMVPALLFALLLALQGLVGINYCGVGYHVEAVMLDDPAKVTALSKLLIFFPATYAIAVTFPKLSILAMYLRIFRIPFYRAATYFIFYFLIVSSTVLFLMILFQCTPVNFFWDKTIEGGKCHFDIEKLFLYASLPNIITDILMLALPLPFILTLNMTRKVKVGLAITFLTGSSGLATSVLRFVSFARQSLFPDTSWAAVDLALYTILETSMYIIAACLPACRPLFNTLRHGVSRENRPESTHNDARDDIELQQGEMEWNAGVEAAAGSSSGGSASIADRFSVAKSLRRFKRLGSDTGLGFMHIGNLMRRDTNEENNQHLSGGARQGGMNDKGVLRMDSRETIFKKPDRAHVREYGPGQSPDHEASSDDGIRVKQDFDVYYDRPPL
ncbi:integral membrane protein [Rutstroemia sp. NJR-2017a WRK4]|nr:integral membrane protein [Rutstroemia sp. NJR-2017a WRK4]